MVTEERDESGPNIDYRGGEGEKIVGVGEMVDVGVEEGSGRKVGSDGGGCDKSMEVGEIVGVGVEKVWKRQGGVILMSRGRLANF